MSITSHDETMMRMALDQARLAVCLSPPNPAVGCVLCAPDGSIIGVGHTQRVGEAHAEVMALRDARERGLTTWGATAYVTLEPCSHTGRTPPCVDALIEAQLARVVVAIGDPNPLVAGQGLARLRQAGIDVELGLLAQDARELNIGFFSRMQRGLPWVRLKAAASLDGVTALANGQSQWITGPQARHDTHLWRARAGAIVSGIGTILADDAQLNVRLHADEALPLYAGGGVRQPQRVVVDSHLRIPLNAKVLSPAANTWVATAQPPGEKSQALEALGVRVLYLPDAQRRVDLRALMLRLAQDHINEVLVESGAHLNGALVQADCVDELLVYLAPKMLGSGLGLWTLDALNSLEEARQWELAEATTIGPDARLRLYHPRSAAFLRQGTALASA